MTARVSLQPAYLLSRRPYRDTSLLLEVFTPHHGRLGMVARGARGPKSKLRGLLQDFTPLLLSWQAGGELQGLQAAEAAGLPLTLQGERIFHGWYLNELLLRLLPRGDAHPSLFEAYALTLVQLGGDAQQGVDALRYFEMSLLTELGYAPTWPDTLEAGAHYRWDAEHGIAPLEGPEPGAYAGSSLLALRDGHLHDAVSRRDARELLRRLLAVHLGGRPLRTPQLLREMRANRAAVSD